MFERSRGHIIALGVEPEMLASGLDRVLRRWDLHRSTSGPGEARGQRGADVFEFQARPFAGGTLLAVEDLVTIFEIAYKTSKTLGSTVVLASRAYQHADWALKVYRDRDCILKVGEDADRELAWLGRPLEAEGVESLASELATAAGRSGPGALRAFLSDVVAGRPDPRDLVAGLGLPELTTGYAELVASPREPWSHLVWEK